MTIETENLLHKLNLARDALKFYADEEHFYKTRYSSEDADFLKTYPTFIRGMEGYYTELGSCFYENGSIARKALDEIEIDFN